MSHVGPCAGLTFFIASSAARQIIKHNYLPSSTLNGGDQVKSQPKIAWRDQTVSSTTTTSSGCPSGATTGACPYGCAGTKPLNSSYFTWIASKVTFHIATLQKVCTNIKHTFVCYWQKVLIALFVFQALRGGEKGHAHYGWVLVSVLNLLESWKGKLLWGKIPEIKHWKILIGRH